MTKDVDQKQNIAAIDSAMFKAVSDAKYFELLKYDEEELTKITEESKAELHFYEDSVVIKKYNDTTLSSEENRMNILTLEKNLTTKTFYKKEYVEKYTRYLPIYVILFLFGPTSLIGLGLLIHYFRVSKLSDDPIKAKRNRRALIISLLVILIGSILIMILLLKALSNWGGISWS